jgi:hypothetical protein
MSAANPSDPRSLWLTSPDALIQVLSFSFSFFSFFSQLTPVAMWLYNGPYTLLSTGWP